MITALHRASALALSLLLLGCADEAKDTPHILLITLDTTRADALGCYGNASARTPVIDGLASNGVLFERAITVQPMTQPSHASILTGLLPPGHGLRSNSHGILPDSTQTLAEILSDQGYQTAAFVAAAVLDSEFGFDQGFETYDDELGLHQEKADAFLNQPASNVNERVTRWLQNERDPKRPAFLWVHYFDPHTPYQAPASFVKEGDNPYDSEIAYVDSEIGALIAAIDESLPDRERITVLTADHGESLGEHGEVTHGYYIYDATMHVPMIFEGPGVTQGKRIDGACQVTDIAPTLIDLIASPQSPVFHGESLVPYMDASGPTTVPSRPIWTESFYAHLTFGWSYALGLEVDRMKLIDLPNEELYDIREDPTEKTNLASLKEHESTVQSLRDELRTLDQKLRANAAQRVETPSERARELLDQMGYLGGGLVIDEEDPGPDLKERLEDINQYFQCRGLVFQARKLADIKRYRQALNLARRAEQIYRRVRAVSPKAHFIDTELANALLLQAHIFNQSGNLNARAQVAGAIIDLFATKSNSELSVSNRLDLAYAHLWTGDKARYRIELESITESHPYSFKAWLWLGEDVENEALKQGDDASKQSLLERAKTYFQNAKDRSQGITEAESKRLNAGLQRLGLQ